MKSKVCLVKTDKYEYPRDKGFRPDIRYPEYCFDDLGSQNHVYDMVREGFHMMGYDAEHWNTPEWNPLRDFVQSGDVVVIKPNMVLDKNLSGAGTDCLFTHPSVVAPVIDYVIIALKGVGKIIVGDAPMQECNFDNLIERSGYKQMCEYYQNKLSDMYGDNLELDLVDFRELKAVVSHGIYHSNVVDSQGIVVDMGQESEFCGESKEFFDSIRITNYDPNLLKEHHNLNKNEYCINTDILSADVVINMPKPKTHRKAGVTIALKNIVGINARKEYLPHHTNGSVSEGGDEYLEKSFVKKMRNRFIDKRNYYAQTKKMYKRAWLYVQLTRATNLLLRFTRKDKYTEGSWYGNDTITRTIVDLNKILFFADKQGVLQKTRQRKYLVIADMIISGEKDGPVAPSAKEVGLIAMGENPVCFDEAIAKIMGAKTEYIKTLWHARNAKGSCLLTEKGDEAYLLSNDARWNEKTLEEITKDDILYFTPIESWKEAFLWRIS